MNRWYIFPALLLLSPGAASAQGYTYCNQVIGATGFDSAFQGRRYAWTVGETMITTLRKPFFNIGLTQGFHQPEFCRLVSTADPALQAAGLRLFPNPAVEQLFADWSEPHLPLLRMQVFSPQGHLLETHNVSPAEAVPCSHWAAGLYTVRLIDPATGAAAVFRVAHLTR